MANVDRRARKTQTAILNQFINLMAQKPISEITIRELAEAADINRWTFYLHYTDIYDLLRQTEDQVIVQFQQALTTFTTADHELSTGQAYFKMIMQYVTEHQRLLGVLCQNPDSELMNKLVKMTIDEGQRVIAFKDPQMAPFILNYCCWGIIGILHTAMRQATVDSETLNTLVDQLLVSSLAVGEATDYV